MGRTTISLLALLISGQASAVGLGELRGQPVLGEALRLEVALIGADRQRIDASCFRLLSPAAGDDLPWLRKAAFAVRKAGDQVLEIRSDVPLREPVMQMRIQLGCGHEISRDYILMASPVRDVPRNALGELQLRSRNGWRGAMRRRLRFGARYVCARCNRQPILCRPA